MPLLLKPARGRVTQFYIDANAAEHSGKTAHYGVDFGWYDYIAQQRDTRVFAAAAGILRIQPVHEGYGLNVLIEHGILGTPNSHVGYEPATFYAHLASIDASLNGTQLAQGQDFAVMGSSGNYTSQTHLHFELRARMQPTTSIIKLDPTDYFGGTAGDSVTPLPREDEDVFDIARPLYRYTPTNKYIFVDAISKTYRIIEPTDWEQTLINRENTRRSEDGLLPAYRDIGAQDWAAAYGDFTSV